MEVSNVEACFAISVRFKGEGGGLRMKLTFFVSQASANFCDGPLLARLNRWRTEGESREVLQNEIRMQIFVKLGLRTHESSEEPANRRVVLQTEN